MWRTFVLLLVGAAILDAPARLNAQDEPPGEKAAESDAAEASLKTFFLAMIEHDEESLLSVVAPTDPEELKWLLRGQPLPPEALDEVRKEVRSTKFNVLQVGDKIKLPNRTYVVTEEDVGPGRVALQAPGEPLFHRVRRIDEAWRVDPRPIIAARKAAETSRQRRQDKAESPQEP